MIELTFQVAIFIYGPGYDSLLNFRAGNLNFFDATDCKYLLAGHQPVDSNVQLVYTLATDVTPLMPKIKPLNKLVNKARDLRDGHKGTSPADGSWLRAGRQYRLSRCGPLEQRHR